MGFVLLIGAPLYLAALAGATASGFYFAKLNDWSPAIRRLSAGVGFLLVFLPVFWDWIPTVWLHSYYCDNNSGLTVNKTLDDWQKENPGVIETLVQPKSPRQLAAGDRRVYELNQRFRWEVESTSKHLGLRETQNRIVDSITGEVLVRLIDYSDGMGKLQTFRDFKVWLARNSCPAQGGKEFGRLLGIYKTLGVPQ